MIYSEEPEPFDMPPDFNKKGCLAVIIAVVIFWGMVIVANIL